MILGSILNPINSSIIAVALVPIGIAFGAPASQTTLLVSALYFATAIGQPLAGRLIDLFGPRGLYLAGAALTTIAGIIGAFAPSLSLLIIARVVLGLGTCAGYPASMSLLRRETERTAATGGFRPTGMLTALSVANQTVAVVGPTLGGLLVDVGGWRSTFAINIPLGLACFVCGLILLPRREGAAAADAGEARSAAPRSGVLRRLDIPGILLFAALLVSLMLFLMNAAVATLWLLAVVVLAGAGLAFRELRAADPFIDLRVMGANIPLLTTYLRGMLTMVVAYAMFFGFPQWLQVERGFSAVTAGLLLLPTFATSLVVAAVTGRHAAVRAKLVVGAVAQIVGCVGMLFIDEGTHIIGLVALAVVFGVPQGLLNLANQNAMFGQARPASIGASAGLLRTFMYLGAILAAAAIGVFFHDGIDTDGLHGLSGLMLGVAATMLVLVLADRSLRRLDATGL